MDITLNFQEAELLEGLLKKALAQTRQEIYRSDASRPKDDLRREEQILRGILAKLTEEA